MSGQDESFTDFAVAAIPELRRLAYLVSGDWHRADDLTQSTLERMCALWPRRGLIDDPDAYARRVLTRRFLAENRRSWRRREASWAEPGDAAASGAVLGADHTGGDGAAETRLDVMAMLATLPPRQRAVVVLRYLEDRSVEQVADLLDVSTGTVKRHCHDALGRLRARADPRAGPAPGPARALAPHPTPLRHGGF